METAGKYRKTDSFICTVLEAEERNPLTCDNGDNFTDVPGTPDHANRLKILGSSAKEKTKVKNAYLSSGNQGAASFPRIRSNRCCKPEIIIVSIALFFILLILTAICACLYFELSRKTDSDLDSMPTTVGKKHRNSTAAITSFSDIMTEKDSPTSTTIGPTLTSIPEEAKAEDIGTIGRTYPVTKEVSDSTDSHKLHRQNFAETTTSVSLSQTVSQSLKVSTSMTTAPLSSETEEAAGTSAMNQRSVASTKPSSTIDSGNTVVSSPLALLTSAIRTSSKTTSNPEPVMTWRSMGTETSSGQVTSEEKATASSNSLEPTASSGKFSRDHEMPIFFLSGPYKFHEASEACVGKGARLALKGDLVKAWDLGYNKCAFGWLRDMHVAMVMQEDHASMDCERGKIGVQYKPAKEPLDKYSGAYCTKDLGDEDIELKIGAHSNKTVNWWVTVDPADAFNLRETLMSIKSEDSDNSYPLLRSLKSIYTCCNAFNISVTDGKQPKTLIATKHSDSYLRTVVDIFRREMAPAKIFTHVSARYNAMMKYGSATTNRSATIKALVSMAKNADLDGIVFDYEPRINYTREHAEIYREFLDELNSAMTANNMTLGTVISAWGILKYYDIYARSNVNFMGSMGSTYYGHNVAGNRKNVLDMINDIDPKRLEIGLGLMYSKRMLSNPKRNYRWKEEELKSFLAWSKGQGINRFHVYSGHWRAHRAAEPFFLKALANV